MVEVENIGYDAFLNCHSMNSIHFGMGQRRDNVITFPPVLKMVGSQAFLTKAGGLGSFATEVNLSRKTKLKSFMGVGPFPNKHCAIVYYD